MPVLSASEIHAWDEFTMKNEPISSIDLMERAANACFEWLSRNCLPGSAFSIFCGKGNNGGDGLALARMLAENGNKVTTYILEFGHKGTEDFQINLSRLHATPTEIRFIQEETQLSPIPAGDYIIDALLGSGLNRPVTGVTVSVINHLNQSANKIISIDIPSGLFVDKSSKGNLIIKAHHTLSFQCQKLAFLVPENQPYIGKVEILDISLHPDFQKTIDPVYEWIDRKMISGFYRHRKSFSHKGTYGHALIVAGSYGKMGAAILTAHSCLRSGAGLVTVHLPASGLDIVQTALPEVMCDPDEDQKIIQEIKMDLDNYQAIGIGPGLGLDAKTGEVVENIIERYRKPIVIDADALNLISRNKSLMKKIPSLSILTPHPKEFERLFGDFANDFERIERIRELSVELQVVIVLKDHHTLIATPAGKAYFNSTGNAGMATGGTGDVLTGLLTGLIAQKYSPTEAAIFGVYLHGASGDLALEFQSEESLIASDLIEQFGMVILTIKG